MHQLCKSFLSIYMCNLVLGGIFTKCQANNMLSLYNAWIQNVRCWSNKGLMPQKRAWLLVLQNAITDTKLVKISVDVHMVYGSAPPLPPPRMHPAPPLHLVSLRDPASASPISLCDPLPARRSRSPRRWRWWSPDKLLLSKLVYRPINFIGL
jgi:hypothetical protein